MGTMRDVDGHGDDLFGVGIVADDVQGDVGLGYRTRDEHASAPGIVLNDLAFENRIDDVFAVQALFVRLVQRVFGDT